MSNQSELDPRNQEAIQHALEGAWDKAVMINLELVNEYPDDTDVLNRLGKAYSELGQVNKARATYQKVLEEDPYNPIATKNLERLSTLRGSDIRPKDQPSRPIDPDMFIEEPGKTKTIEVVDLAMPKVLISLRVGDKVKLSSTKDSISVISEDDHRLGKLEQGLGVIIAEASTLGSEFDAVVKSIHVGKDQKNSQMSVFVRETVHSKKLVHPTFTIENNNFTPFVREDTLSYLKEEPVITDTTGESEEVRVEDIPHDENSDLEMDQEDSEQTPTMDIVDDEEDFSPK